MEYSPSFDLAWQYYPHCVDTPELWLPGTMLTSVQKVFLVKVLCRGFIAHFSITVGPGIQQVPFVYHMLKFPEQYYNRALINQDNNKQM